MSRLIPDRWDVYLVNLDLATGAAMRKTRPCVVVSPEEMHRNVYTVIIVPMTGTLTRFPTRVRSNFGGRAGELALDQLRAVDIKRFGKRLGRLDPSTIRALREAIEELFR